jgi:hypothetical protein
MIWVAPTEKDTRAETLEDCLWRAADLLRAKLRPDLRSVFTTGLRWRGTSRDDPWRFGILSSVPLLDSLSVHDDCARFANALLTNRKRADGIGPIKTATVRR